MGFQLRLCDTVVLLATFLAIYECTNDTFRTLDKKYYLVKEAYNIAKSLFNQGRANYVSLKTKSLRTIDTFLDLVYIMNDEMAKELRSAVLKFYKVKYLHDFTNYIINMEEMIDIIEHCLIDPVEKLEQIRTQFHDVIKNFQDVRNFDSVNKCHKELPDEVAAAHCLLHQAVLFNETMQESLVTIVEIKTRQHAQDMNSSLYDVQKCLNNFVPKFFEQMMLDAYTDTCGYLRVVNASIADLLKDKWRGNETVFPEKWSPLVRLLKERRYLADKDYTTGSGILNTARRNAQGAHYALIQSINGGLRTKEPARILQEPLFLTLLSANLSSQDVVRTLYKK